MPDEHADRPPPSTGRKVLFYSITLVLSFLVAVLIAELVIGQLSISTGTGQGVMHKRWMEENWRPLNELGYRDDILSGRLRPRGTNILFLGDSLGAGHGVPFETTFFYRTRAAFPASIDFYNLSRNGLSTKAEMAELVRFNQTTDVLADVLVHQYFFNDIEDYVTLPPMHSTQLELLLANHSSLADLVITYARYFDWGKAYLQTLEAALTDPVRVEKHLDDLDSLHNIARAQRAKVIFVPFPFPDLIEFEPVNSTFYQRVKAAFLSRCRQGDVFIDVKALMAGLPPRHQVVNLLDTHPSEMLHQRVAAKVSIALGNLLSEGAAQSDPAVVDCPAEVGRETPEADASFSGKAG